MRLHLPTFVSRLLLGVSMLFLGCVLVQAQPYGNEWIKFGNTYYKFRIHKDGIYRIAKSQLDALGMGSVPGQNFALFRDGKEVPVFVSNSGVLSNNDYIEFFGEKANGEIDKSLYHQPANQPNAALNIISDTAFYFLTHDASTHQRLQAVNNIVPTPAPTPAPYCWSTVVPTKNNRGVYAQGYSYDHRLLYYSSDFDIGEGYAYNSRSTRSNTMTHPTPQKYAGSGSGATLSFVFAGHALNPSGNVNAPVQHINNTLIGTNALFDTSYSGFAMIRKSIAVPMNLIGASNTQVINKDNNNYYLLQMSLRYTRLFNFSGNFSDKADFTLPANERYLSITGFNVNAGGARLVDRTQKKIYSGLVEGSVLKFYMDASSVPRDLFLSTEAAIEQVTAFTPVAFINYTQPANQGDYIILSHADYLNASPNYLDQYRAYRSSATGGNYHPVMVDVAELYDQFGYGYEFHPIAIRNFLFFAKDNWSLTPAYLFIVGKGLSYNLYSSYRNTASQYSYKPVPTFGFPGADNLFAASGSGQVPFLPVGRLSAWNNEEIGAYLTKVKDYEQAIKSPAVPTVASEFWKKSALHIAGGNDMALQDHLKMVLANCAKIFEDTLIGGVVHNIAKSSTDPVDDVNNAAIDTLVNNGLGYITYYGHGSSSGFDYNLNSPDNYNSKPRYPVFSTFACEVADIFNLTQVKTISEKYIDASDGGAIAMIAGNNTGWTNILQQYMPALYRSWGYLHYGKTLGTQYQKNIESLYNPNSVSMSIHLQALLYQGDPALRLFNPDKPDYVVEEQYISTAPANLSTASDSFTLQAVVYNLGRATQDSVAVTLAHTRPGNNTVLYADTIRLAALLVTDTVRFRVPIDPQSHVGMNNYVIKVDGTDRYEEVSEQNNQATIQAYIYSDNLEPVYPYEFSIVHQQGVELKASTLNAFAPPMRYKIELDTTEQFNSNSKQSTTINSTGGVLKWTPNITLKDSTVYYWRTAADSVINGAYNWSYSSFIYLANGSDGWNQSHYYQYKKDEMFALQLPAGTRKFGFSPRINSYKIENKVIYPPTNDYHNVRHSLNDEILDNWGCIYTGSIHIAVFDSVSGKPWANPNGAYGSAPPCSSVNPYKYIFEFATNTLASRNNAKDFIESIPAGNFVMIKNMIYGGPPGAVWDGTTATDWMNDQDVNGSGNSLYHAIYNLGFNQIDEFNTKKAFVFFTKKGDPSTLLQEVTPDSVSKIEMYTTMLSYPDTGRLESTELGPATAWQQLQWKASATDQFGVNDSAYVTIIGIKQDQSEQTLYAGTARDTSLSFISAATYPKIRLVWNSVDNITRTSSHLDYWRVLYKPVPEAALNAMAKLAFKDSLMQGEQAQLQIAIENISPLPMDSMLVKYKLIDAQNQQHVLAEKRYKKLPANDTLIAAFTFDPSAYPGKNFLFIEANPDNDQPEQYHPNNLGYLSLHVTSDLKNPLLDVTFDGIHILDKDIVSAKPFIKIQMRDENTFMPLNDTALMRVQLVYPDQTTPVEITFDGTICKFIPADHTAGNKNEALIEFKPVLKDDGLYKLIVAGKDKMGNIAGNAPQYEINFMVENKPSITHVLNYPNPFSTATQFVFTLTGSEVPSQFKVQILSVTGKVVREITKDELGPLHIGRNMTEYRWDGRDQFGQLLGNGVYLYRVITSIRGTDVEHRANQTVDKYFKNGYGKLYIMR